jgi:hypothetical protein
MDQAKIALPAGSSLTVALRGSRASCADSSFGAGIFNVVTMLLIAPESYPEAA